jgi:hypothetical protein
MDFDTNKLLLLLALGPLLRLANKFHQAGCFVGRGRTGQSLERICCQVFPEKTNDIELLPPAIKDLETGPLAFTAYAAVIKAYRMP